MVLFISQRILDAVSHPYSGTSQDSRWLLHRMDRGRRKERPGPSLTSQIHTIIRDHGSQSPQIIFRTKAEKVLVTHFLALKRTTFTLSEAKVGGIKSPISADKEWSPSRLPSCFWTA